MRQRPENALAKTITMNKNCIPVAVLVAGALFALSTPLRAQIATQVDEHGKLVFVNGDSPNARRGSTISPTVRRVAFPVWDFDRVCGGNARRQ